MPPPTSRYSIGISILTDLGVSAGGLLHRVLDALDVGQLRADMKVQQPEHVDAAGFLQPADDLEDLGRRQTELRRLAARLFPFARAF